MLRKNTKNILSSIKRYKKGSFNPQGSINNANKGSFKSQGTATRSYDAFEQSFTAKNVVLNQPQAGIVTIAISNPPMSNALDLSIIRDMRRAVQHVHMNSEAINYVVFKSDVPNVFTPGLSVREKVNCLDAERAEIVAEEIMGLMTDIKRLPAITNCALDGFSMTTGLEIAMACDLRYISKNISGTSFNDARWGAISPGGSLTLASKTMPLHFGKEMLLTSKMMKPNDLDEIGFGTLIDPNTLQERRSREQLASNVVQQKNENIPTFELASHEAITNFKSIQMTRDAWILQTTKRMLQQFDTRSFADMVKIEQKTISDANSAHAANDGIVTSDRFAALKSVKSTLLSEMDKLGDEEFLSSMDDDVDLTEASLKYLQTKREAAERLASRDYTYNRRDLEQKEARKAVNAYEVVLGDFKFRKNLWESLYPFQRDGVKFLYEACEFYGKDSDRNTERNSKSNMGVSVNDNMGCALLADDMGIGKSFQCIAYLDGVYFNKLGKKFLLLLPKTLAQNWIQEIEKWIGIGYNFFPVYDCSSSVNRVERQKRIWRCQRKPAGGLVIATYGSMNAHPEIFLSQDDSSVTKAENGALMVPDNEYKYEWDYVICDEGHIIRNANNQRAIGMDGIGNASRRRLILTGTPFQNDLMEFWRLFDWLGNGKLLGSSKDFEDEFANDIKAGRTLGATPSQVDLANKRSIELKQLIEPYFIRRMKSEVFKDGWGERLVFKSDLAVWIKPTIFQQNLYNDAIDTAKNMHQQIRDQKEQLKLQAIETRKLKNTAKASRSVKAQRKARIQTDKAIGTNLEEENEEDDTSDLTKSLTFQSDDLTNLRQKQLSIWAFQQICNHPYILNPETAFRLGLEGTDTMKDHIKNSSKMQVIHHILQTNRNEKTLLFTRSVEFLDIIEHMVRGVRGKLKQKQQYIRFDGGTQARTRQKWVNYFNNTDAETCNLLLMTTQVGGYGLTITSASRVIMVDPSWNPAEDQQAIDRVFRIGQENDVVIYRLLTCGTIEESIFRRQVFKSSMGQATLAAGVGEVDVERYFSADQIFENVKASTKNYDSSETCDEIGKLVGTEVDEFAPETLDKHLEVLTKHPLVYGYSFCERLFKKSQDEAMKAKEREEEARNENFLSI